MTAQTQKSTSGNDKWPAGTGMIYLAISPWDSMWKNRHQLMSRFAREMPVLYVEPWRGLRRVRRMLIAGKKRPSQKRNRLESSGFGRLQVLTSGSLPPVSTSKLLGGATQRIWLRSIRAAALEAGIRHPILWISHPRYESAIGKFGELLSIYHIVDEYGGYTSHHEQSRSDLWRRERAVLRNVDMAIAVSNQLVEAKSGNGAPVNLVENAVDYAAFERWRETAVEPLEMAGIPSPRLGYCGLIGKRLNIELLDEVARSRPDHSIVLVGRVDDRECADALEKLRSRSNVYFLGEKSVEDVPAYVSSFDAGLLPYELNLETENISPLKMYEYLAAGLPVISTAIPAAEKHRDNVTVCSTAKAFVDACSLGAASQDDPAASQRRSFAKRNSWEARVEQIRDLIQLRLAPGVRESTAAVAS